MHGCSRLGSGRLSGSSSPSPPSSPRLRHGRGKGGGRGPKLQSITERIVHLLLSAVFRRRGVLLFAPLVYISGMLIYMGTLSFDVPGSVVIRRRPTPGSTYRSPQVFEQLWPFLEVDGNSSDALSNAWHLKLGQSWKPCLSTRVTKAELPSSTGFLIIEANGGLNQQRLSICDAVAVAGLLNATLVIPIFHLNSVWRDSSKFGDIFDEEYFIDTLKNDVRIVKHLPEDVLQHFDNNISNIVNLRVKAWSSPSYYLKRVLPKLLAMGAVRIAPFSNRLAHAVPPNIQGLRCLANYEALRFSKPIRALAENMVDRMVKNSSLSGGKYISVHLRFEEDMVAFSCCIYDGGEEEKREMDKVRERGWRGKFNKTGRVIRPGANRINGKCPLTPLEVGMMLRGMGFDNTTSVYVASGKIYKEKKYIAPLRQLFPRLETKETIASPDELAPFKVHSSRLAALDYTVCLHSEVFVTTQGGNFPHFLMGHRRYLYEGHAKTIKPDKRKLTLLFDNPHIRWDSFKQQMREMLHHSDVKGIELKKPSGSLYNFPMPDCMCQQIDAGLPQMSDTATLI
ncbi:GDP-fucose protein O-fucosyltransferase [Cinnamomum micranthum f. kanehirae]|uniref:O-fucosyltransferase family protein n=1 Tax=Cinnamomum micranthum f. kanehirae TaxID=337451 RepID=A0A3S3MZ09_9MAGN|nr:GDP-fucose protein O-fucosyltransferase [Cinnamomum micranthum f. kanehirae]